MNLRKKIHVAAVGLAVGVGLTVPASIAWATGDTDKSIGEITTNTGCTAEQAKANDGRGALGRHGDDFYRCRETAPDCYEWKWVYDGRPKSGRTYPTGPCPTCTASPTAVPSASGSAGAAGTTPAAAPAPTDTLPVTGTRDLVLLVGFGLMLAAAGVLLLALAGSRRSRP